MFLELTSESMKSEIIKTYACHCGSMRTIFCVYQKRCKEGENKLGLIGEIWQDKEAFPHLISRGGMGESGGITWALRAFAALQCKTGKGEWTSPALSFCITASKGRAVSSRTHCVAVSKNYAHKQKHNGG